MVASEDFSIHYFFQIIITEVNSTSEPTSELGQLLNDIENDPLNKEAENEEDAVEDILYMRGASFTIHLDPATLHDESNSTVNDEPATTTNEIKDADNEIPSGNREPAGSDYSTLLDTSLPVELQCAMNLYSLTL